MSSASVNLTTEVAIVWPVSEAKLTPNWQKQLGETLAKHLTNCGFNSNIRGKHFKFHYHELVIVFLFYFILFCCSYLSLNSILLIEKLYAWLIFSWLMFLDDVGQQVHAYTRNT